MSYRETPSFERGRYLVCTACHGLDFRGSALEGSPPLVIVARYSPEQFRHLLRTGKPVDGRDLPAMSWMPNVDFTDQEIADLYTFSPLREADLPLLHDWIHRPHVAEWWGGGDAGENLEDTKRKYLPRLQEGFSVKAYIALFSGEPIGFIQSYVALGCGDGWWEDETDPGVRGIDQFLCDGSKLGQGLGSRMVAAFVRKLFEDPGVTKVQTDPDPTNVRAIRCYEKAGFRPVEKLATPDGPALLMSVARALS